MTDGGTSLDAAFDAAAHGTDRGTVSDAELAFAERVLEARRTDRAAACPRRVLRRAQSIFRDSRKPAGARWLRPVGDSWRMPALATRGTAADSRFVRVEGGAYAADLRLDRDPEGAIEVQVAITPHADLSAHLLIPPRAKPLRVTLDDHGAATLALGSAARELVLILRRGTSEVARTDRIAIP